MQKYKTEIDILNDFIRCWNNSNQKNCTRHYSTNSGVVNVIDITFHCKNKILHVTLRKISPHINVSLFFEKNLKEPPRFFDVYVEGFAKSFKLVEINQNFYVVPIIEHLKINDKIINIYYFDDLSSTLDKVLSTIGVNERWSGYNRTIITFEREEEIEEYLKYLINHYEEFLKLRTKYLDNIDKYCYISSFISVTGCKLNIEMYEEIFAENLALVELYEQFELSKF